MTIFISAIVRILLSYSLKSTNPVKVRTFILFLRIIIFFTIYFKSSQTWIPILILLLFIGGIIIIFIILSSILPNEKTIKIKNLYLIILPIFLAIILKESTFPTEKLNTEIKSFLSTGINFYTILLLILIYFLASISILSVEQSPIRSISCC